MEDDLYGSAEKQHDPEEKSIIVQRNGSGSCTGSVSGKEYRY